MDNISPLAQNNAASQANKSLKPGDIFQKGKSTHKGDLGKDAFLKLLVTELRHQDPTSPMKDREFISQMAQFSALEQMTGMNNTIQNLNRSARSGEAYALLGKRVEALNPVTGKRVHGTVSSIFFQDNEVRLMVDRDVIGLKDIHAVFPPDNKNESSDIAEGENQKGNNEPDKTREK